MAVQGGGFTEFLKTIPFDQIGYYYKQAINYGVVDVAVHPFDFADILIRLGYEPFPPIEEARLFSGKSLVLPGIMTYVYYLYSIGGINGTFRGVVPYVAGNLIYRHLSTYVWNRSPYPLEHPESEPRLCVQFTNGNIGHFVQTRFWRLFSNLVGLHVAYPFHVIAIRTMARFVTAAATSDGHRPEIGESWISELRHIRGFDELFAGCQARVLKEIAFALIAGGSFLGLMKIAQLLKADPGQADSLEQSVEYIGNSIATVYVNPFRNASDIMIINKTDLPLGNPPFIDHYSSCWECCRKLRKDRKWKTSSGRGLFQSGRYYHGPTELQNGQLVPRDTFFGPVYLPPNARRVDDLPSYLRGYYNNWGNMGGLQAGRMGFGEPATGRGSLALSELKTTMMSEKAPLDILGLGSHSKSLYFIGSSNNPLGL